jgi:hypothetical protein
MAFSRHRLGQVRCSDPHVQAVHCGLALGFSSFLQEKSHYATVSFPQCRVKSFKFEFFRNHFLFLSAKKTSRIGNFFTNMFLFRDFLLTKLIK